MNKDRFIRMYLWLSIAVVLLLVFLQVSFGTGLMGEEPSISGEITTSLFQYKFENIVLTIDVLNTPLIMYIAFTILTIVVAVYGLKKEPVKQKLVQDLLVYNGIISILLIVSNIVYMILFPDTVSGILEHNLFLTRVPVQGGSIVNVFNFTYLFMLVYIILNLVVLLQTKEKTFKEKKDDTELDSEFLL